MPGATIGEDCTIGQNVMVAKASSSEIAVRVQNNVSIYTGVTCEERGLIGPSAVFTNVINPRSAIPEHEFRNTFVRKGATIGANATIVCGPYHRGIRFYRRRRGTYTFGSPLQAFSSVTRPHPAGSAHTVTAFISHDRLATCPESGEHYRLQNDQLPRSKVPKPPDSHIFRACRRGHIGQRHAAQIARCGRLTAVADILPDRARQLAHNIRHVPTLRWSPSCTQNNQPWLSFVPPTTCTRRKPFFPWKPAPTSFVKNRCASQHGSRRYDQRPLKKPAAIFLSSNKTASIPRSGYCTK